MKNVQKKKAPHAKAPAAVRLWGLILFAGKARGAGGGAQGRKGRA